MLNSSDPHDRSRNRWALLLLPERKPRILSLAPPSQQSQIFVRIWSLKEALHQGNRRGSKTSSGLVLLLSRTYPHCVPSRANDCPGRDDPLEWRFWEWHPAHGCVAALAVRLTQVRSIQLDAGPARAADVGPL